MDKAYTNRSIESQGPVKPVPSLVRGSKSSTDQNYEWEDWEIDAINDMATDALECTDPDEMQYQEADVSPPEITSPYDSLGYDLTEVGHSLVITCDAWRGIERTKEGALYTPLVPDKATWKAVVHRDLLTKNKPPEQFGDRWTNKLSSRGKKAIEDSARYLAITGRGYRTFFTLTLRPEWRAQIDKWDQMKRGEDDANRSTIGRMVTEFVNVLQQRYRNGITFKGHFRRAGKQERGGGYYASGSHYKGRVETTTKSDKWTPIKWRDEFSLCGQGQPFQFVWVIENPKNAQGELNPHIHVLMNWSVKLDRFHAWAAWIERTWGKGFAKLERIKKPAAAAHYMAKAANYLTKGAEENSQQGPVRGNRYSVSKDARPPKSRLVGRYWSDMIRDAIAMGVRTGRENWPKGLWFHRHGFGASSRAVWNRFWQALKADGVKLNPAPKNLYSARFANAAVKYLKRRYDFQTQWAESLYRDAIDSENWVRVGALL